MAEKIPEGEFYAQLYVERGAPLADSVKFRSRLGAFFAHELYDRINNLGLAVGPTIRAETGYQDFDTYRYYRAGFEKFFQNAPLVDVFTAVTIIWRELLPGGAAARWQQFVERALREENLRFRVDRKGGVHPAVDREFERSHASVLACLAEPRYAAVQHAADSAFEQLNILPMDGKAAARDVFEAAEALVKIITGSGAALDERLVGTTLRPICDRLFAADEQLKSMAGRLLSSFGKWVDAVQAYRHGHDRELALVLPDDFAVLTVSEGASFIRWLVDLDRRNQAK